MVPLDRRNGNQSTSCQRFEVRKYGTSSWVSLKTPSTTWRQMVTIAKRHWQFSGGSDSEWLCVCLVVGAQRNIRTIRQLKSGSPSGSVLNVCPLLNAVCLRSLVSKVCPPIGGRTDATSHGKGSHDWQSFRGRGKRHGPGNQTKIVSPLLRLHFEVTDKSLLLLLGFACQNWSVGGATHR